MHVPIVLVVFQDRNNHRGNCFFISPSVAIWFLIKEGEGVSWIDFQSPRHNNTSEVHRFPKSNVRMKTIYGCYPEGLQ